MDYIKIMGIGILGVMFIVIIKEYKPEFAIYISIACTVLILSIVFDKLKTIIDFIQGLTSKSKIDNEMIKIILKITGISLLIEFAVSLCKDCNVNAIANKIDLAGKAIIISMSIPIISKTLESLINIIP